MSVGKCLTAWRAVRHQGSTACLQQPVRWLQACSPIGAEQHCKGCKTQGVQSPEEVLSILPTLMPLSNASPCSALMFTTNTPASQPDLSQPLEAICNIT